MTDPPTVRTDGRRTDVRTGGRTESGIAVRGAAEHNLADLDVVFGSGITAVVGVSGSGKSSLVLDTVYTEARRRLMETLALGSPWARVPPARVRRIDGLGPAVAVGQNVLNRNPSSTVASASGLHPFLRVLFARLGEVCCPRCGGTVRPLALEERLQEVLALVRRAGADVEVPLVRALPGAHARLLAAVAGAFEGVTVDAEPWDGRPLDPARPHDVTVRVAHLPRGSRTAAVRAVLERADALGSTVVVVGGRPLLRAPVCPGCGERVPRLEPAAFSAGAPPPVSHRVGGSTLGEVLSGSVADAAAFAARLPADPPWRRLRDELRKRLEAMRALALDHLTLDRPMPTLSRGESQRVRLAVVLAARLEGLLHVLDEPTIGLHRGDVERLLAAIGSLPGPVLMVEHDRAAVAFADDVVEIGPGAGPVGGRLVFQGPPERLRAAGTPSSAMIGGAPAVTREPRPPDAPGLRIAGAHARNLRGFDCEVPIGRLTAVTGPSGAGKTTLVRAVLLASLRAHAAVGCAAIDAPRLRVVEVDQSPLGNNPRSNPATYTKAFDRIRAVMAAATGASASELTFNRAEGGCPTCEGLGAIEVKLPFVAPEWLVCEACGGSRFRPETLAHRWDGRSIAEVLACSVDEARRLFATAAPPAARSLRRILDCLAAVGLGYLRLGQPSPTLSGGEAQRVRLARALAAARDGDLVVLDEPTTGLHPADLARLVEVLDRLTARGCTVVAVEHHPDVVACADWVVELGPGGGPQGGALVHCGPPRPDSVRAARPPVRRRPPPAPPRAAIEVRGAGAHNLRDVDVDFAKGRLTVVTGVSGSGKSSLVNDVLGAEAVRRLLECLSLYERQSAQEGPEAPVRSLGGLGPTLVLDGTRHSWGPRATVGGATELDRLVAVVLARAGERSCRRCGRSMRRASPAPEAPWRCEGCGGEACPVEPRHLTGAAANALCRRCSGLGSTRRLVESRLVRRPEEPVCGRCLHSPGYYPRDYLCTPGTGGNGSLMGFARRWGFDPYTTPWDEMSEGARHAFLYGDPEPYPIEVRDGLRVPTAYGSVQGDRWYWGGCVGLAADLGGLYSEAVPCTSCGGKRLRPDYLSLRLGAHDRGDLFAMPLRDLERILAAPQPPAAPGGDDPAAAAARATAVRRLGFLLRVGLGYVHLDRPTWTLSAGEAQRVKLAAVVGSELTGITVLLDEPSRGLHAAEVAALGATLRELCAGGNTVVAVDHDAGILTAADELVEMGPGAGRHGGRVVWRGAPGGRTSAPAAAPRRRPPARRRPTGFLAVRGARENNLAIAELRIPLGVLVGVCGVSGSGKSSLVVDTLGLALAPPRTTTGVAWRERVEPGAHDGIAGAPPRTVVADQSRRAIASPGTYLGIVDALRAAYADSGAAAEAGLRADELTYGCDACRGRGSWQDRMWFLPPVARICEACGGSGYRREAAEIAARGSTLAEAEAATIEEVAAAWEDVPAVARATGPALRLGLGYLAVRQPGWALSGGEAQRLAIARVLGRRNAGPSLYLLDEPTVGLHATDVERLAGVLQELVGAGHSVVVVEHDAQLLAACDWLIELGPGAGPDGGRVVFEGTPEELAATATATAPYVGERLA